VFEINEERKKDRRHYHSCDRRTIISIISWNPGGFPLLNSNAHVRQVLTDYCETLTQSTQANFRHFDRCYTCGGRGPDYVRPPWKAAANALRTLVRSFRFSTQLWTDSSSRPRPVRRRVSSPAGAVGISGSWDLLPFFFSWGPLTCAYLRTDGPSLAQVGIPRGSRLSPESLRVHRQLSVLVSSNR